MMSIYGLRIMLGLWINHYRALKYKPREASLWTSLNPFSSEVFYETIRKGLRYLGLHFCYFHKSSRILIAHLTIQGQLLAYDWNDRAQVLATIGEVFKDHQYGPAPHGLTVDVGASIGEYSLYACKTGTVIAIEPLEKNFNFLQINALGNRIAPLNLAIGERTGYRQLFLSELSSSCSFETEGLSSTYAWVETKRLDRLCDELGLERIDTLKIDAEGSEMEILKSAGLFLEDKRIKRVIVASYHYPSEAREVEDLLSSCGYSVLVKRSSEVIVFGLAMVD